MVHVQAAFCHSSLGSKIQFDIVNSPVFVERSKVDGSFNFEEIKKTDLGLFLNRGK